MYLTKNIFLFSLFFVDTIVQYNVISLNNFKFDL